MHQAVPPFYSSSGNISLYNSYHTLQKANLNCNSLPWAALPCQPFLPCMATVFGASPVSGTTVKYSTASTDITPLMSQSGWTRGLGWRRGNDSHQKL